MLWAICSNTTISPVAKLLSVTFQRQKTSADYIVTQYGEALQQILQPDSLLYAARPDWVALYFDLGQLRPGVEGDLAFAKSAQRADMQERLVLEVLTLVREARANCAAKILVNNFPVQPRTVLGIGLDSVWKSAIRSVNLRMAEELATLPDCFQYDCDSLWAEAGWADRDRRIELLAQLPFGPKVQQLLVDEWIRYYRITIGKARKCVVVDLDNTLWRGILGEDGQSGINMDESPQGRPYRRLQQSLQLLKRRGVLLAVCSKNNPEDAMMVLRDHPDMLLRDTDFAALRVNWQDKATNILAIAAELNIGPEHMVFLDDSPAERQWVRDALPEVLVPELPADAALFSDVLTDCELDALALSDEDLRRTEMYTEERNRRTFQVDTPNYEDFLKGLELAVQIERLTPALVERAAQLCQRTNQFNLTTRRYTVIDLQRLADSPASEVFVAKVRDRFGDYGWSALAVVRLEDLSANIDSFMVSCRVLGKQVESSFFRAVARWARNKGCLTLSATYYPTSKNAICADFYSKCGMVPSDAHSNTYVCSLSELPTHPFTHIDLLTT